MRKQGLGEYANLLLIQPLLYAHSLLILVSNIKRGHWLFEFAGVCLVDHFMLSIIGFILVGLF